MKIAEIIFLVFALLGLAMFTFHLPMSGQVLLFGLGFLGMLYFYFSFALLHDIKARNIFKKSSYKQISSKRIFGAIATGITLQMLIVGILFKLMQWPMANMNIAFGLTLGIVVLILSINFYVKTDAKLYKNVLLRLVPTMGFAIMLYLFAGDPATTYPNETNVDQTETRNQSNSEEINQDVQNDGSH